MWVPTGISVMGSTLLSAIKRDFDTRPIPPISMNNSNWWYPSATQGPAKTVFTCIAVVGLIEMKENHREDEILACCRSS